MTDPVKVVLDVHEPPEVHDAVSTHPDVGDVLLAPLESADLSIAGVGFERKTWDDYVDSMKDGRLEDQSRRMAEYDAAYVLVEGALSETNSLYWTDMSGKSIRGHMASLTAREEYGVRAVIPCSNTPTLVDMAIRLARKHTEDPTSEYLPTGAVDGVDEPPGKMMWGCLPHVGPELADRLWQEFGSPVNFSVWCETDDVAPIMELCRIDGIGEDTSRELVKELWTPHGGRSGCDAEDTDDTEQT